MRILKGSHTLRERRLKLTLSRDLELGERPVWLQLAGANGLGKTTFIEKILIPGLKGRKIPFLYLGQDFRTQVYTLKALLAVELKDRVADDMPGLLTQWVTHHRQAKVLILDEFDKYPAHAQHIFKISRDFIRTYVTVSHAEQPVSPGAPFDKRVLLFRPAAREGGLLRVGIEESGPWS